MQKPTFPSNECRSETGACSGFPWIILLVFVLCLVLMGCGGENTNPKIVVANSEQTNGVTTSRVTITFQNSWNGPCSIDFKFSSLQ